MSRKNERTKVKDIEKALDQDERIELWIRNNYKKCAVAMLVLIAVVVTVLALYIKQQNDIRRKSVAIAEAKPEALPALLAENPDLPGAGIARLRLADYLLNDKKDYAGAESVFNTIAQDASLPVEIRNSAKISAVSCIELSGKSKEACEAFVTICSDPTASPALKCEAVLQAARLLLTLKEQAKAVELLQEVANWEIPAGGEAQSSVMVGKMYAQALLAAIHNGDFN